MRRGTRQTSRQSPVGSQLREGLSEWLLATGPDGGTIHVYVHLGGDLIVAVNDVVAILDVRLLQAAEINREFADRAMGAKRLWGDGITPECKSLVVTTAGVFTSAISAPTLARRMTHLQQSALAWEAET